MLFLGPNEKVLLVVRKHWFVVARQVVVVILLLLAAPLLLGVLPVLTAELDPALVEPLVNSGLSLYIMVLLIFFFLFWTDYYLDMWIITTERIVDIEQRGLFSREVSEIPLQHVQDVTIEIRGIVETFLRFGTIRIQTAGEREFTIKNIPRLYEAKNLILKYARSQQNHGRPLQMGPDKT